MEKTNILKLALTLTGGMLLGTIFIVLAISWTGPTVAPPGGFTETLITQDPIFIDGGNIGIGITTPTRKLDVAGIIRSTGNNIINNIAPTLFLQDTNHRSAMIHTNANQLYFLRGSGNNSLTWQQTGGRWPLVLNLENNDATFGGDVRITGSGKGVVFPDGTKQTTAVVLDCEHLIVDGLCFDTVRTKNMGEDRYGGHRGRCNSRDRYCYRDTCNGAHRSHFWCAVNADLTCIDAFCWRDGRGWRRSTVRCVHRHVTCIPLAFLTTN